MLDREIDHALLEWQQSPTRHPLLLRGARQVGKTYAVQKFGKTQFKDFIEINFEREPSLKSLFSSLIPQEIVDRIELRYKREVVPGQTLIFLDEIQECPKAIMALRYFKEEMPALHVIGAGSLLEFALKNEDFRMPVGRVEFMFLYPLSFREFLSALDHDILLEKLDKASIDHPIDNFVHEEALKLIRTYFAIGGMPASVATYKELQSLPKCQNIQTNLLMTYRSDFGKYARLNEHKYLARIFEQIPLHIAQWLKYTKLDPGADTRSLKNALKKLCDAGLIHKVHATRATGIPLIGSLNPKKFKPLYLDIGLAHRACQIDMDLLLNTDLMLINQGALAEQFVGQELLANHPINEQAKLFFWSRENRTDAAEVDYLQTINGTIIPIEVKSGATGRLRSLQLFLQEKQASIGVRISTLPLAQHGNILSVPFYLIHKLPQLIHQSQKK